MGIVYTYQHPGEDGGTWYAAAYPLGATRYYSTPEARAEKVNAYVAAIRDTGGFCMVSDSAEEE